MFFANPVAALRNVREALVPHGRLMMVVWRDRTDNAWLYRAQQIVERFIARPAEYDEPTCGPGPFSMAGADTTSDVLLHAGFTDIAFRRCDHPIVVGHDIDEAIELVTALGPAGEILRLAGDSAAHLHGEIFAALREGLGDFAGPSGVGRPRRRGRERRRGLGPVRHLVAQAIAQLGEADALVDDQRHQQRREDGERDQRGERSRPRSARPARPRTRGARR